jgi:hypothetical protein
MGWLNDPPVVQQPAPPPIPPGFDESIVSEGAQRAMEAQECYDALAQAVDTRIPGNIMTALIAAVTWLLKREGAHIRTRHQTER